MWTEEMDRILTSPAARRIVPQLSPVYGDAYVALWLFNAIGHEIDNIESQTNELSLQTIPQTTTWGIPYWEEDYGLPSDESLPMEVRRRELLTRIRTRAPMNPRLVKSILESLTGTPITVKENISKNRFEVVFGDVLDNSVKKRVKSKLEEIKPAHLLYLLTQTVQIAFREQNSIAVVYQLLFHFRQGYSLYLHEVAVSCLFRELVGTRTTVLLPMQFTEHNLSCSVPKAGFLFQNLEHLNQKENGVHFSYQNEQKTTGTLTYNRPWKFNGKIKFNGNQKFNAGIEEEAF